MHTFISFNINGVRARQHQLIAIKEKFAPTVMGLQETKVHDSQFPLEDLSALGWYIEYFGQKAHYGVALVSTVRPIFVQKGFPSDNAEHQKRFIHCKYKINDQVVDVMNGYFPQGESRDHPLKFPAKKQFYADLNKYIQQQITASSNLILMGDMNISPQDIDIGIGDKNKQRWLAQGKCSFLAEEREWYQQLLDLGLIDTYRLHYPEDNNTFSWFDYRSKGFNDNPKRGLRIDHILTTKELSKHCSAVGVDYEIRAQDKPSDHAPVWAKFDF